MSSLYGKIRGIPKRKWWYTQGKQSALCVC